MWPISLQVSLSLQWVDKTGLTVWISYCQQRQMCHQINIKKAGKKSNSQGNTASSYTHIIYMNNAGMCISFNILEDLWLQHIVTLLLNVRWIEVLIILAIFTSRIALKHLQSCESQLVSYVNVVYTMCKSCQNPAKKTLISCKFVVLFYTKFSFFWIK